MWGPIYYTESGFSAYLRLFPSPSLPHSPFLMIRLDRLCFCAQRLRAGEPLWRGIAFNRDEVLSQLAVGSSFKPQGIGRALQRTASMCLCVVPRQARQMTSPRLTLFAFICVAFSSFKSTVETSVWRRRELYTYWEQTTANSKDPLHLMLLWHWSVL